MKITDEQIETGARALILECGEYGGISPSLSRKFSRAAITAVAPLIAQEAAKEIAELRAALEQIEYLDRPQVRGLPRPKTIQQIALEALGQAAS